MVPPATPLGARAALGLAAVTLLTRVPFLMPGYGTDTDAWRVAVTARTIAATGRYQASRLPGYPVQELTCALLQRGGPLALNGATALLSAVGVACFARALSRLGVRDAALAALALALTPVVYINSVNALDYMWALAFLLGSLACSVEGRAMAAGSLLGLAVGCRISSGLMALPLSLMLAGGRARAERSRALLTFGLAAAFGGALAIAPLFVIYGGRFMHLYEGPGYPPLLYVLKGASVDVWGVVGCVALICVAPWFKVGRSRAAPLETAAVISAALLMGGLYLRLPHEGGYLLPAVPFVILGLARVLPRRAFVALCAALMVSPFVFKVSEPGKSDAPPPSRFTMPLELGGRALELDPARGPIFWDHARRVAGVRYRDALISKLRALPRPSVVVAHEWLWWLREAMSPGDTTGVRVVYLLEPGELRRARDAGVPIYYLMQALGEEREREGVDLAAEGGVRLDPPRGASRP